VYEYKVKLVRVVDGDTVVLDVDKGFQSWLHTVPFRLAGINTPEISGPKAKFEKQAGLTAKKFVVDVLTKAVELKIKSSKAGPITVGSFGRWLAVIFYKTAEDAEWMNLNQQLMDEGYAVAYKK
jgi:micrococcal nuclease